MSTTTYKLSSAMLAFVRTGYIENSFHFVRDFGRVAPCERLAVLVRALVKHTGGQNIGNALRN